MRKTLPPVLALGTLALVACGSGPTQEELEAECSPEFLLQYDLEALDVQYEATVEAADLYGLEGAELDLEAEANICLDFKAEYEVQQQSYEGLALQVEAQATAAAFSLGADRVDRGLRWVTYEFEEGGEGEAAIPPGWLFFVANLSYDGEVWRVPDWSDVRVGDSSIYVDTSEGDYRVSLAYPF